MRTQAVVDHFGSRKKVAEALNLTPQAISAWGDIVPPLQASRLALLAPGVLVFDPAQYEGWYSKRRIS